MDVVYVDEEDAVIGHGPVEQAAARGMTTRISRVFILNDKQELLLQKRLKGKWDQSAGGHVDQGESYHQAAARELYEEMGLQNVELKEISKFHTEDIFGDVTRKRFNMIFLGNCQDQNVTIDEKEVSGYKWTNLNELETWINDNPNSFTKGFLQAYEITKPHLLNAHSETIQTYDNSAQKMAEHFQQYSGGIAKKEINKTFELVNKPIPKVVEIGCGAGKDASDIIKYTSNYEGFDPSSKLLGIAKKHVPGASFVVADALTYQYPKNIDIVFAFASLLHLSKEDFAVVAQKISKNLQKGGVVCMTLKEADEYTKQIQEDEFGTRLFYLYSARQVQQLMGKKFNLAYEDHRIVGPKSKKWMSLIFVKQ